MALKLDQANGQAILTSCSEAGLLDVPETVIVEEVNPGLLDSGRGYCSLVVVSKAEKVALDKVDMADRAGRIKVSCKNYNGEDLSGLKGKELPTDGWGLEFDTTGQYRRITAVKFSADTAQLAV